MNGCYIGGICLVWSLFLFFISPKEGWNMFGYKSIQQNAHKKNWYWANKCFGFLALLGSLVYLIISIVLKFYAGIDSSRTLNKYGLLYFLVIIVVTEVYAFVKKRTYKI